MSSNKDEILINLLKRLANEEKLTDNIEQYTDEFKNIYVEDYRHKYSDIHSVLLDLRQDARDYLSQSIRDICENIPDSFIAKEKLFKLYDHIILENMRSSEFRKYAERVELFENEYDKYKESFEDTKQELKKAKEELENTKKYIEDLEEKLKGSETQSITILGIFTGIVMTFTGGLSFTSSALQNMNGSSKYRLILVILLLGATVFNIIYMLIYSIGKINGKYIGSECNCRNKIKGCNYKTVQCSLIRYPVATCINIIIVVGLILTLIVYCIDKYNLLTLILNKRGLIEIIVMIIFSIGIIGIKYIKKLIKSICKYEYKESCLNELINPFSSRYVKKK